MQKEDIKIFLDLVEEFYNPKAENEDEKYLYYKIITKSTTIDEEEFRGHAVFYRLLESSLLVYLGVDSDTIANRETRFLDFRLIPYDEITLMETIF